MYHKDHGLGLLKNTELNKDLKHLASDLYLVTYISEVPILGPYVLLNDNYYSLFCQEDDKSPFTFIFEFSIDGLGDTYNAEI